MQDFRPGRVQRGTLEAFQALPKGLAALKAIKDKTSGIANFTRQLEPKIYGRVGDLEVRLAQSP